MKRYARCPICGARVVIEYGNVLREHVMNTIAPGGYAGKVAPLCRGVRPNTSNTEPAANAPLPQNQTER